MLIIDITWSYPGGFGVQLGQGVIDDIIHKLRHIIAILDGPALAGSTYELLGLPRHAEM
jgi:hypothetical protein